MSSSLMPAAALKMSRAAFRAPSAARFAAAARHIWSVSSRLPAVKCAGGRPPAPRVGQRRVSGVLTPPLGPGWAAPIPALRKVAHGSPCSARCRCRGAFSPRRRERVAAASEALRWLRPVLRPVELGARAGRLPLLLPHHLRAVLLPALLLRHTEQPALADAPEGALRSAPLSLAYA